MLSMNPLSRHPSARKRAWALAALTGGVPLILFFVLHSKSAEKRSWQVPRFFPMHFVARSLAYSPDSKLIAIGEFYMVNIWDIKTGEVIRTFGLGGIAQKVAFSADGTLLACGGTGSEGNYGSWFVWDWQHEKLLASLSARSPGASEPAALAFYPDNQTLAGALGNGELQVWNLKTYRQSRKPGHPQFYKMGVALSSDGKTFARREAGTIPLYNTQSLKPQGVLKGSAGGSMDLAFAGNGSHLASFDGDDVIRIWNVSKRTLVRAIPAKSQSGIGLVALSSDGALVTDSFKVWKVATGEQVRKLALDEYRDERRAEGLGFSPDGSTVATGTVENAELWRLK